MRPHSISQERPRRACRALLHPIILATTLLLALVPMSQAQPLKLGIPVPDMPHPDANQIPINRTPVKRAVRRPGVAETGAATPTAARSVSRERVSFEVGSGRLVTLRAPAANVFVADPKVADVRPGSATSLFVFGLTAGRTSVAALDDEGQPVAEFEVTVRPSAFNADAAEAAVTQLFPTLGLRVRPQPKGLLVTGQVPNPQDAARAIGVVKSFLSEGQAVEDQIAVVQPSVQVQLRVRIAEMSRSVTRGLGVNWSAMGGLGSIALLNPIRQASDVAYAALSIGNKDANSFIDALATDNLARILAEPNLVAMSGQSASFLAGGEFPVPVASGASTSATGGPTITVEYKKYGVQLSFLPTVLSDGRINLKVAPEVSQLSSQGAVTTSNITVPALVTRRAETMVELGSGESFAIAGLLQQTSNQNDSGLPGLGDVPVLGALFRSDKFQRNETELVIIVTPYIVRPVASIAALHVPGDEIRPPSDLDRILLLRQVGHSRAPRLSGQTPGQAGFVIQ